MFNMIPGGIRPVTYATMSESGGNTYITTALRIGGTSGPFHQLHMSDGNIFMEGGGEVGHIVKRLVNNVGTSGPLGDRTNPIFTDKRISQAGDGDFEVKTLFAADEESERVIFKWDSKGIFATIGVSGLLGRQNEGYLQDGHVNPWYAINSEGSEHRYELGPGGASDMDVAFTRTGTQTASIQVGPNSTSLASKMTFYGDAIVPHQPITYPETATPSNPSAGNYKTYFKSDGNFYKLDSSGTEAQVGGGGGGGGGVDIETVLGSASDEIVVTGLSLSTDRVYQLASNVISAVGSNDAHLLLNTDTVQTGYTENRLYQQATGGYGVGPTANSSTPFLAVLPTGAYDHSGFTGTIQRIYDGTETQIIMLLTANYYDNSVSTTSIHRVFAGDVDITKITLKSNQANGFSARSYLKVWK